MSVTCVTVTLGSRLRNGVRWQRALAGACGVEGLGPLLVRHRVRANGNVPARAARRQRYQRPTLPTSHRVGFSVLFASPAPVQP